MALALYDRVQQTGTANTTVSFTLTATPTGYQSFAVVGNANTTYYSSFDSSGNWEVGIGTYATGGTLTRTTILSSSNSGSAVTFSGSVTVFVTQPAEQTVVSSNNPGTSSYVLTSNGSGIAPTWQASNGTTTNALTIGTGLSGTSFNGSTAVTIAIDSTVATLSGTQTLTNKRVTPRVSPLSSNSSTYAIDTDSFDIIVITSQTATITSITTTGTPTNGQKLWLSITGTTAVGFTLSTSNFEASTVALPTTTVSTNRLDIGFVWNVATSKWRCVAQA